jgi:hypothetical protein
MTPTEKSAYETRKRMRSPMSASSTSLRRPSGLLHVDSDGLAIDSIPLAPNSGRSRR